MLFTFIIIIIIRYRDQPPSRAYTNVSFSAGKYASHAPERPLKDDYHWGIYMASNKEYG